MDSKHADKRKDFDDLKTIVHLLRSYDLSTMPRSQVVGFGEVLDGLIDRIIGNLRRR